MSTALYGNFSLSSNTNDTFLSVTVDDMLVYPDSNSQRVHIGVNKGVGPAICVSSNGVGFGSQSNPQYPLDVAGGAHITGALLAPGGVYAQTGTVTLTATSTPVTLFSFSSNIAVQTGIVSLVCASGPAITASYNVLLNYVSANTAMSSVVLGGTGSSGESVTANGSNVQFQTTNSAYLNSPYTWSFLRFM